MSNFEGILGFLEEYADFMEEMEGVQQEKLDSLLSKDLVRIEKSIVSQQAYAMRLDNIEKKRIRVQAGFGFDGKSFSEIIELASGEVAAELRKLFTKVQASVMNIKHLNGKATEVAEANIRELNMNSGSDGSSGFVETKI